MSSEFESACVKAFTNQCTVDSNYIPWITTHYRAHIIAIGRRLLNNENSWPFYINPNKDEEFIDFIDGNGFNIKRFSKGTICKIVPIIHTYEWE